MNWYTAKLVFQIICGDGSHTPQFDEQLRLIAAATKEEAFHKAQVMGGREEEAFFNSNQQLVKWQFISISELHYVGELSDGAELYSRIEEKEDAENYVQVIYKKAGQIMFGNITGTLNLAY